MGGCDSHIINIRSSEIVDADGWWLVRYCARCARPAQKLPLPADTKGKALAVALQQFRRRYEKRPVRC